jgi:hypothetical protein
MKDMLTSWYFWKPILKWIGWIVLGILFLLYGTTWMVLVILLIAASGGLFYFMYLTGKWAYDDHMKDIKRNYKNLSGKEWDEK